MATIHVGTDRLGAAEALIATLAERIANKIEDQIQADLDWLKDYEAIIPLMGDDGDEEIEDEELWTAADQWREQISNR